MKITIEINEAELPEKFRGDAPAAAVAAFLHENLVQRQREKLLNAGMYIGHAKDKVTAHAVHDLYEADLKLGELIVKNMVIEFPPG